MREDDAVPQPRLDDPAFKADPFPFFARLRRDAPAYRARLPGRRSAWLVTRYDDALDVLRDGRFVKNPGAVPGASAAAPWVPGFLRPLTENMLDLDGADHARLRRLVSKGFTPRRVEEMRDGVERVCRRLLGRAAAAGRMDLVRDLALPLPVVVIADLLGIPEEDRAAFHRWSDRMVSLSTTAGAVRAIPGLWRFMRYLRRLVALRRRAPRDDLVSALIAAEDGGETLSEDELLAMITILLVAGHETTVNLIAVGTLALLQAPEEMRRLRETPALMPSAVEELLRFASPVSLATERYAAEELRVAGTRIARGDQVLAVLASANRDETQFAEPDVLRLDREPNRHLALGQGIHYCLGAPLARLEAQVAFAAILDRLPGLRLDLPPSRLRWKGGVFLRGLAALPVAWDRSAR